MLYSQSFIMQRPPSEPPTDPDFESANLASSFQTLALCSDWPHFSAHPFQPTNTFNPQPSLQQPLQLQPDLTHHYSRQVGEPSSHLPTEAELSRRARAASGLDVSAPEFVPSFATQTFAGNQSVPQSHQHSFYHSQHITKHQSPLDITPPVANPTPSNFNVYTNVTDLQPLGLPIPAPSESDPGAYEDAVDAFDRQFPALPSSSPTRQENPSRTSNARALGWEALQRREVGRARVEAQQDDFEAWKSAVYQLVADEEETPEFDVSQDVGDVWVSTGTSVAELYQELRAEASVQASIRNKFFDRAAVAFKRGDGAAAKKLSAQGRDANERMKELHQKAANAIFEARNSPSAPDVIDLHGLHVSEAVERLPAALERAPEGKVRILTGTGHHTKGTGRARLRPAVKQWLQESPFYFSEVVDANEFVGSFIVDVKR